jgi:hypothetical protein
MKISKEDFDSLYSNTITKREYDAILRDIDYRFSRIIEHICPRVHEYGGWFDYDTIGEDENQGVFDPKKYMDFIYTRVERHRLPKPYEQGIPTRFLWEDFESEVKREIDKFRKKEENIKITAKQKRENLKQRKKQFKEIIQSKLTKEELKFIKFK